MQRKEELQHPNCESETERNLFEVQQIASGQRNSREIVDARIDSLVGLYMELDHVISLVVINRNNSRKVLASRANRLIDLINAEELALSRLLRLLEESGLPNKATKSLTDINTSAIRTIEELERLRQRSLANESQVLDRVCHRSKKDFLGKLASILLRDEADAIISELLEVYIEIQGTLSNHSSVVRVYARRRELREIEAYLRREDNLKEIVEKLTVAPGLGLDKKMALLDSLELLAFRHPRLSDVKAMVPGYPQTLDAILKGATEIEDTEGVSELFNQAARNFIGKDEQGKIVPFVMGALNELMSNIRLKDAGFQVRKLACRFVEFKPFMLDASGNDLLQGINFSDPKQALEELLSRELVVPAGRNQKQVYRFKACTLSHIHYFDSVSGEVYAHKNNKSSSDLRILILEANNKFTKMEIDCIADRNNRTYYIEHKVNVSSVIKKEQEGEGQALSQLEKLFIVAKSHNCLPCIMLDMDEVRSVTRDIDASSPLYQAFKSLLFAIESKYNLEVLILDSDANEVELV